MRLELGDLRFFYWLLLRNFFKKLLTHFHFHSSSFVNWTVEIIKFGLLSIIAEAGVRNLKPLFLTISVSFFSVSLGSDVKQIDISTRKVVLFLEKKKLVLK